MSNPASDPHLSASIPVTYSGSEGATWIACIGGRGLTQPLSQILVRSRSLIPLGIVSPLSPFGYTTLHTTPHSFRQSVGRPALPMAAAAVTLYLLSEEKVAGWMVREGN